MSYPHQIAFNLKTKMKILQISFFIGAQLFDHAICRSASEFDGETFTATQTYVQSTQRMTCPKLSITNGATCENDLFEHNDFCDVKCSTGYELSTFDEMPKCSCFHDYGLISIPRDECIWMTKPNNQYCLPVEIPTESEQPKVSGSFNVETHYTQTLGEITCDDPNLDIKNGTMVCNGVTDGDLCTVQCDAGHEKTNQQDLKCSCFERFGPILNKRPKCIWLNTDNQECNPTDQSDINQTESTLPAFRFQTDYLEPSGTLAIYF